MNPLDDALASPSPLEEMILNEAVDGNEENGRGESKGIHQSPVIHGERP